MPEVFPKNILRGLHLCRFIHAGACCGAHATWGTLLTQVETGILVWMVVGKTWMLFKTNRWGKNHNELNLSWGWELHVAINRFFCAQRCFWCWYSTICLILSVQVSLHHWQVFPNLPTWMIPQKWRDSRGLTIEARSTGGNSLHAC